MEIIPAGEGGAYVRFGREISATTSREIDATAEWLRNRRLPWITDVVPGFVTLYIEFDVRHATSSDLAECLGELALESRNELEKPRRRIEIPVCYGGEFGPDLSSLAAECCLTEEEAVRLHCEKEYHVHFLGFTPGFAFMGTVDERIALPRLKHPRTRVAAGSVGIAGSQTGVYPVDSPGGWRIVGRTPMRLASPSNEGVTFLLRAGDRVLFRRIDDAEFPSSSTA